MPLVNDCSALCRTCIWFEPEDWRIMDDDYDDDVNYDYLSQQGLCYRYPKSINTEVGHYCGEWTEDNTNHDISFGDTWMKQWKENKSAKK